MRMKDYAMQREEAAKAILVPAPVPNFGTANVRTTVQPDEDAVEQKRIEQDRLRAALQNARLPDDFRISRRGLEAGKTIETEAGEQLVWEVISKPIAVTAYVRTGEGSDWSRVVVFADPDGILKERLVSNRALTQDPRALCGDLAAEGFVITPTGSARAKFLEYLSRCHPDARATLVDMPGWNNGTFLLGDRSIGGENGDQKRQRPGSSVNSRICQGGSAEEWREMAGLLAGNSRLVLSTCAAFAAPLLHLCGAESGGFHLFGGSSSGKTTALYVAGSVIGGGGPRGFVSAWRTTTNGLEGTLVAHNDLLLPLDEIHEANARDLAAMVYQAINGATKARARADGSLRQPKLTRGFYLSAGEMTIADRIREGGDRVRAGMELRFADIPADAGAGLGIFEELHGFDSPREFAEHLKSQALRNYGWGIKEFIQAIAQSDRQVLVEYIEETRRVFFETYVPMGADGQVGRVANRFALAAAAGGLAGHWGIVPWDTHEVMTGAVKCFQAWLLQRGGSQAGEAIRGIEQVMAILAKDGVRLFMEWRKSPGFEQVSDERGTMLGWRRQNSARVWEYFAHADGFKELVKGYNPQQIADALVERGILERGQDGGHTTIVSIPGFNSKRVYRLCPHGAEEETAA